MTAAVSTPAATAPAAAPAAAPAPAIVSTPAVPGAQVSPSRPKLGGKPQPAATATSVKMYGTSDPKPNRSVVVAQAAADAAAGRAPAAVAKPAAAPVVAPAVAATPAASAAEVEAAATPEALAAAMGAADATAAGDAPAVETPAEPAAAETEPAKLSDGEFAKRMAHIASSERKLARERMAFAEQQKTHAASLDRVRQIEQAGEVAKRDPVGFLGRMWGVTPQAIVDALLADQNKPAAQRAAEAESGVTARIAKLEKDLEESAKATKAQTVEAQRRDYVSEAVAPIVTNASKFPFLNHELGASAAEHVYLTMEANWKRNPSKPPPSPEQVATFIEAHFRNRAASAAKLLGGGAATPQTAIPKKVETPQATTPVSAQPAPAVELRRPRLTSKPYTSQPK